MPQITVSGMHCQNCVKAVTKAASEIPGVRDVHVELSSGALTWVDSDAKHPVLPETIKEAVRDIGFDA